MQDGIEAQAVEGFQSPLARSDVKCYKASCRRKTRDRYHRRQAAPKLGGQLSSDWTMGSLDVAC